MTELLLRKGKLSKADWLVFLEEIRQKIKPKLDKFTLPTFGNLACIDDRSGRYYQIIEDVPLFLDGDYTLADYGLSYFTDDGQRLNDIKKESRKIHAYGLSRGGEWVIITVNVALKDIDSNPRRKPLLGSKDTPLRREYAFSVTIFKASLEDMLKYSKAPVGAVWMILRMAVEDWERKRRVLLEDSQKLTREFQIYDEILMSL